MRFAMKFSIPSILALGIILGASVSSCYGSLNGKFGGDRGVGGDIGPGGGTGGANCNSAADCTGGLICTDGRCASCTEDSNCATGQSCVAGVCRKQSALGEACGTSTDCLNATMECAPAPRSVCVKKGGELCWEDKECLFSCRDMRCLAQPLRTGNGCYKDNQCADNHVCSLSGDPETLTMKMCLKLDGQKCDSNAECQSYNCNGQCQPCVAGVECSIGNGCSTKKTTCRDGRTLCEGADVVKPDFTSCTDPNNEKVDTCYSGSCKMKLFKKELTFALSNYFLETNIWSDSKATGSALANVPIYAEISIGAGVRISSAATSIPAMKLSGLPNGSIVKLVNKGQIWGAGGNGGQAGAVQETNKITQRATDGAAGGHAIYTEYKLLIDNTAGDIRGGGGGGGGGGGIFQWLNCDGLRTTEGIGGGGGGGAGATPGNGGSGCDTPSTYFGAGQPGANGSEAGGGAGGVPFTSYTASVDSCKMYSYGGTGGKGGNWGEAGQDGLWARDSDSKGVQGMTYTPRALGGLAGYAIYRANDAELTFLPGKDAAGKVVTGNGTVMGDTAVPLP